MYIIAYEYKNASSKFDRKCALTNRKINKKTAAFFRSKIRENKFDAWFYQKILLVSFCLTVEIHN